MDTARVLPAAPESLFAPSGDLVTCVDLDGTIRYVNQALRAALDFTETPVVGLKVFDLIHPSSAAKVAAIFARLRAGEDVGLQNLHFRNQSGGSVELEGRISVVYENGQPVLTRGVFRRPAPPSPVSQELRARYLDLELKLREGATRAYFSDFSVEHAPIGVGWIDSTGRIIRCNQHLEDLLDISRADTPAISSFMPGGRLPWQRQPLGDDGPSESAPQRFETPVRSVSGREFIAELVVRGLRFEGQEFEFLLLRDISEQKQAEAKVAGAQRLESMGVLAGGVAHDLNNTLAPIILGLDLLRPSASPAQLRLIDGMQASAERAAGLVTQMLMFAKRTELRLKPLAPQTLLGELGRIIANTFPKNIQVEIGSGAELPSISGDDVHLLRVLLNLTLNARDAMPKGGQLTVTAEYVDVDAAYAATLTEARPGTYVRFNVTDTGTGIPPEIRDRIFDPFFTTKGPDKGTGLGLSAVHGIVKGHRGFLKLYSEVGRGTRFSIYLPILGEAVPVTRPPPPVPLPLAPARKLALIVDDEAFVREVVKSALEGLGFQVITVEDGARALTHASRVRDEIGLVMTDLHMPNLNGITLTRALRRLSPDIPIIVMSGRIADDERALLTELGVTHYLAKPFNQASLAERLHQALANSLTTPAPA